MMHTKHTWLIDLALITLFFIIAYGAYLGSYPLFIPDDARYLEISREMARSGDYLTPHLGGLNYFEKPPLFYWLDALAIEAGGNSLWAGRAVNALFALFGCVVIYAMGRWYYNNRAAGWLAAVVLGSSLLYVILAHYVTLDMTLTFCLSTCLFSFLQAYLLPPSSAKRWWCYAAYVFAGLAVLAKGLIGIVLPLGVIGAWVLLRWDWRSLRDFYIPTGLLIFLAVALPWHVLMQLEHQEFFDYYIIQHHFSRYATLSADRFEPFWFFIPVVVVGLLPWMFFLPNTLASLRSSFKVWRADPVLSFLSLWIVVIFVFFSISNSKLVPYILPIFPALALLMGHYFAQCYQSQILPFKALAALGIFTILFALVAWSAPLWFPEILSKYQGIIPYARMVTVIYLLAVLGCWYGWKHKHFLPGIAVLAVSTLFCTSLILVKAGPMVNNKSLITFADYLKPILTDQDILIAYNNYYYDLPFYLDRLMLVTSPNGELSFGAKHQPDNPVITTRDKVWQLWDSPQRVFIVTRPDVYAKLQQEQHPNLWLLTQTDRAVLLSNRPN